MVTLPKRTEDMAKTTMKNHAGTEGVPETRKNLRYERGCLTEVAEGVPVMTGNVRPVGVATADGRSWLIVSDGCGKMGVISGEWKVESGEREESGEWRVESGERGERGEWRVESEGPVAPLWVAQLEEEPMCVTGCADGEVIMMTQDGPEYIDYETDEGERTWRYRGRLRSLPDVRIEAEEGAMISVTTGSMSLSGGDLRDGLSESDRRRLADVTAGAVNDLIKMARDAGYNVMPVATRWKLTDTHGNILKADELRLTGGIAGGKITAETTVDSTGRTGPITIGFRATRMRMTAGSSGTMSGNWGRHVGMAIAEAGNEPEWRATSGNMKWRIERPASGDAKLTIEYELPEAETRSGCVPKQTAVTEVDSTEERSVYLGRGGYEAESEEEARRRALNEGGFVARRGIRYGDTIVWADITDRDGKRNRGLVVTARSPRSLTIESMADCGDEAIECMAGAARKSSTWGFGSGHIYGLSRRGVCGIAVSGVSRKLSVTMLTGDGIPGGAECVAPTADGVAIITSDGHEVAMISGTGRRSLKRSGGKVRYVAVGYDGIHNELAVTDETGECIVMELDNGTERVQTPGVKARYMFGQGGHLYVSDGETGTVDMSMGRADRMPEIEAVYKRRTEERVRAVSIDMTAEWVEGQIDVASGGGRYGRYQTRARYDVKGEVRSPLRMTCPLPKREYVMVRICGKARGINISSTNS